MLTPAPRSTCPTWRGSSRELAAGRPVQQYVLGAAEFCGLRIGVREGVLIPVPKPRELVLPRIASEHRAARSILDVGTGSGCIALALKACCPMPW